MENSNMLQNVCLSIASDHFANSLFTELFAVMKYAN